jgi:hypothetical protein
LRRCDVGTKAIGLAAALAAVLAVAACDEDGSGSGKKGTSVTSVPELDANSAGAALLFLLGGLVLLLSRKPQ